MSTLQALALLVTVQKQVLVLQLNGYAESTNFLAMGLKNRQFAKLSLGLLPGFNNFRLVKGLATIRELHSSTLGIIIFFLKIMGLNMPVCVKVLSQVQHEVCKVKHAFQKITGSQFLPI